MRNIELIKGNLILKDKIEGFLEREVKKFGNSGKVDCPKRFIGRRVYVLIAENELEKKSGSARRRAKANKRSIKKSS